MAQFLKIESKGTRPPSFADPESLASSGKEYLAESVFFWQISDTNVYIYAPHGSTSYSRLAYRQWEGSSCERISMSDLVTDNDFFLDANCTIS